MATFDTSSFKQNGAATASFSWSHTCTGSNLILLVGLTMDTTNTVTGVTYNGVALTQVATTQNTEAGVQVRSELWRLYGPATGANTIAVTLSGAPSFTNGGAAVSLSGVSSTAGIDASNVAHGQNGAEPSVSVTSTAGSEMLVMYSGNSSGVTYTPGAGFTEDVDQSSATVGAGKQMFFEHKVGGVAGAQTLNATQDGGPNQNWTVIGVALKDAGAGSGPVGAYFPIRIPNNRVGPMAMRYTFRNRVTLATVLGDLFITATENVTVTESVRSELNSFVTESESITVTDTDNVALAHTVNKSESITVTESRNQTLVDNVNVSDNITITESSKAELNSFISKTENITVTEFLDPELNSFIVATENITVTDVDNVALAHQINKSESVTVTESVNAALAHQINKSDSITVTESVNAELNSFIVETENVTVSEFLDPELNSFISKSDNITVTESTNATLVHNINKSDNVTVTEFVNATLVYNVNQSESITVTESVRVELNSFINKSESITVTENADPELVSFISATDNVTVTESTGQTLVNNVSKSETVTVFDQRTNLITNPSFEVNTTGWITQGASTTVTQDPTVGLFGTGSLKTVTTPAASSAGPSLPQANGTRMAVNAGKDYTFSVYVIGDVTSSGTAMRVLFRDFDANNNLIVGTQVNFTLSTSWQRVTVNKTMGAAAVTAYAWVLDSGTTAQTFWIDGALLEQTTAVGTYFDGTNSDAQWNGAANASTSSSATGYVNVSLSNQINLSDSITVTEFVDPELNSFIVESENITVTESVTALIPLEAGPVTDTTTVSEAVNVTLVNLVNKSESITVTESIGRLLTSFVVETDNVTVTESVNVTLVDNDTIAENITVTESVKVELNSFISQTENVSVTESSKVELNSFISKSESISVTESSNAALAHQISKSDSITVTESINATLVNNVIESETITVSESISLDMPINVSKSENITVSESSKAELNSFISKSENITVTESLFRLLTSFMLQTENVTVTESLNQTLVDNINKSESITVTESRTVFIPFLNINVSETITVSESFSEKQSDLSKSVSESITVSESVIVRIQAPGRYELATTTIKQPTSIKETTSPIMAVQRTMSGRINADFFGNSKRVWEFYYQLLSKADYDTLYSIYSDYLIDSVPVPLIIRQTNYSLAATNVHITLPDRTMTIPGDDYISSVTLVLTEA